MGGCINLCDWVNEDLLLILRRKLKFKHLHNDYIFRFIHSVSSINCLKTTYTFAIFYIIFFT